jgi:hypothetical protein
MLAFKDTYEFTDTTLGERVLSFVNMSPTKSIDDVAYFSLNLSIKGAF